MDPASKARAKTRHITIRPGPELYERLDRYHDETGVSFQHLGVLGLEMILDKVESGHMPRRKRRPAKSA